MKSITYHPIESEQKAVSGFLMKAGGIARGEYWPVLEQGKLAAVIQVDEILVCMTVVEKSEYYSPSVQLNTLIEGYFSDKSCSVCRVIAKGKVSFRRHDTTIFVNVGGADVFSIGTIPFQTNCCLVETVGDRTHNYYIDFLHPYLYDPLLKRSNYSAILTSILPAKKALSLPIVE